REGAIERACRQHQQHDDGRREGKTADQPHPGAALHGQFTAILLAKFAPMPILASEVWKAWSSRSVIGKLSSCGFSTAAVHDAGALTSRTGSFSAKPKS